MPLLVLDGVGISFPNHVLLERINLRIMQGERLGLVGENGSGKSTLLRIAAGLVSPTEGRVITRRGAVVGYLPQSGLTYHGRTLWDEVTSGMPEWTDLVERRKALLESLSRLSPGDPNHEKTLAEYGRLEERFEQTDGYLVESKWRRILQGLGFMQEDYDRPVGSFSAGWQMRIGLAKVLVREPDLMLLDEPTDHLDLDAKNWLEDYLRGVRTAFVLVSHDRHFLDLLVDRVAEIDNKKLELYHGNYSQYLDKKREKKERQAALYSVQRARVERLERFIVRNRARKDRAPQVQSRIRTLERMNRIDPVRGEQRIRFPIQAPGRAPRILVELVGIEKAFDSRPVLKDGNLVVGRGERIAVIGRNGAGKSTLLRILAGKEKVQAGLRLAAETVSVGYYGQEQRFRCRPGQSVLEVLLETSPGLEVAQARTLLARFRFRGEEVFKPVEALSGGERARLALACIFPKQHHLLLLDEPTNHLDILSRQALLEALQSYGGTVVFVSHDRYFIQELATRIVEIRGHGLLSFLGPYEEFLEARAEQVALCSPGVGSIVEPAGRKRGPTGEKLERVRQRAFQKAAQRREQRRKRRIAGLEREIGELENRLKELEGEMQNPLVATDHVALGELHEQAVRVREVLDDLYGQWESLMEEGLQDK